MMFRCHKNAFQFLVGSTMKKFLLLDIHLKNPCLKCKKATNDQNSDESCQNQSKRIRPHIVRILFSLPPGISNRVRKVQALHPFQYFSW